MTDPRSTPGAADDTNTIEADVKVIQSTSTDDDSAAQASPSRATFGEALRRWFSAGSIDAKELTSAVRDEAAIANEQVQAYVRKEPVKSVLIAAAAGAVLSGLLAAGRSRNKRSEG